MPSDYVSFIEAFFEIGGGKLDQIRKFALVGPEDDMYFSGRLLMLMQQQEVSGFDIHLEKKGTKTYLDIVEVEIPLTICV